MMRTKLLLMLLFSMFVSGNRSFAQTNKPAPTPCSVAGYTESGELAIICRQPGFGICYRLVPFSETKPFSDGKEIWVDFGPDGIRVTDGKGHSALKLRAARTIFLNSRQWPWFGPVSDLVCRAGKESSLK
jgi:hypothetical protein